MEAAEIKKHFYRFTDEKERLKVVIRLLMNELTVYYILVIVFSFY